MCLQAAGEQRLKCCKCCCGKKILHQIIEDERKCLIFSLGLLITAQVKRPCGAAAARRQK